MSQPTVVIDKKVNICSNWEKMHEIGENGDQIPENLKIQPNITNLSGSDCMHWCPGSKFSSTSIK